MAAKSLNVRLAPKTLRRLDAVAAARRQTRAFIANKALKAWIDREFELIGDLRAGIAEIKAGKGIPHERVMRDLDAAIRAATSRGSRRNPIARR